MKYFYDILLPVAAKGIFTYSSENDIPIGSRVSVYINKRNAIGICLNKAEKPDFECKDIVDILDEKPLFSNNYIAFLNAVSKYYACHLGTTLHGVISKQLLQSFPDEKPAEIPIPDKKPLILTEEQQNIADSINFDRYSAHLLYGVTGSGKTEIYLDAAKKVIEAGQKVIYLVPEISLTPQLTKRISSRLGEATATFHSKMTPKQRKNAFWNFIKGKQKIIIGPRSALFIPANDIGLIIIDEEHESTYKQEESPAYHLRDMAIMYAKINNIPIILGSATVQLESYANSINGKYIMHKLKNRTCGAKLPDIHIIDEKQYDLIGGIIAEPIYEKLEHTVKTGKQAIIFLNRKGYSTSLYCNKCGALQECRNCSVPLTMYKNGVCACHYCGEKYYNLICSNCQSLDIKDFGIGTQKVEELIEDMFPGKSVRIDAEKVDSLKKLNSVMKEFEEHKSQIMIGTQIVAKGLHFPDVTFVGILGIDNILAMPDFRAAEKAYQLIMQVSGRAGRGKHPGDVFIQTAMPEHPLFNIIKTDSEAFYKYELEKRKNLGYPPYMKMSRIILSYSREQELVNATNKLYDNLISIKNSCAVILGPAPAVLYKIKNIYRYSILIKTFTSKEMNAMLEHVLKIFSKLKIGAMQLKIDRDPYYFM